MKSKIALTNGVIFTGNNTFNQKALLIDGARIDAIVDENNIHEEYEVVDVAGKNICPGLIDLQIYGTGAHLYSAELTTESIHQIEKSLLAQGCTSFYLTLATNSIELFKKAIAVYKIAQPNVSLGLHLEGPFLNPAKRGAHPADLIKEATVPILENLLDDHQGSVRMMTIAPELMSDDCIVYLQAEDVLLSAGHSNATFEQAKASFGKGIRTVTHLWNAMSPLHHRNVGLPGATYAHSSVYASIIVDGIHVDYEAVKISKEIMKERLFLITDAVAACESDIYHHILNGDHYTLPDGTLSGSALTMLMAIHNCVHNANIPMDEAIRMATLYPANLIERPDLGRLEAGAMANVLVFDENFNVDAVYFQGEKVN
jgi:N-acetylglucosamine-6-phosphate deacetylase